MNTTNPDILTARTATVADDLTWLSARQAELAHPASGDPMMDYCVQLEARIKLQSAEIEALRQMLRSEHERHLRVHAGRSWRSLLRSPFRHDTRPWK